MKRLTALTVVLALAFVITAVAPMPASAKENNGQDFGQKIESRIQKLKDKLFKFENKEKKEDREENEDRDDDRKHNSDDCVPFGIKNAKGIEKRIQNGKGLPPGIAKKIDDDKFCNGTSTPPAQATTTLKITEISATKATSTASISWRTNIASVGEVRFSSTTPVGTTTVQSDAGLKTLHTVTLSGLTPNTTYYYVVVARDTNGNVKESATRQFKTNALAQADITAPSIVYSTKVDLLATSTHLVWITNEPTTGKIWVSTSTPVDTSATSTVNDSSLSYFHNVMVGNLATSTTYYYTIMSTDASSNSTNLTGGTFTTLAQ